MADKKYRWLWIVWILAFVGLEWSALKNTKGGDTLSEVTREWIGTGTPERTWVMWIGRILVLVGLAWLLPHFMTGSI